MVFRPFLRILESLTVCRCHYKGGTLFKDPEFWSCRDLYPRPSTQQTGALPTELYKELSYNNNDDDDDDDDDDRFPKIQFPFFEALK